MSTGGYNLEPYLHGEVSRLGIPGIRLSDGRRGCVKGKSTAFPVPMARGATWDVVLEEKIGLANGRECKAQGSNFLVVSALTYRATLHGAVFNKHTVRTRSSWARWVLYYEGRSGDRHGTRE